jgi:hypothetical protein
MTAYNAVPCGLKDIPHWVVWKYENRDGKETKVPYDAKSNGDSDHAKVNDPSTWASFDRAAEVADVLSGHDYNGVGFVLHGTQFVGFDFDGVLQDGKAEPFVLDILEKLSNPYSETTPSGNGLRAFVEYPLALPDGKRKFSRNTNGKYGAEIYSGSEGGRYLTVTGEKFSGNGVPKMADIRLVYFMVSQITNERLKSLWMGDLSAYDGDQSRADLALLGLFARLFNNDAEKMEWAFSASKLGQRDKWQRKDYREGTIAAAISGKESKPGTQNEYSEFGTSPGSLTFRLPSVESDPKKREYVIAPASKQKSGWFMLGGAPSILCGASGASKTTWMYQLLTDQKMGVPFYGHLTYGRSYIALGADRGKADHLETMERMHLSPDLIPFKPLSTVVFDFDAVQAILDAIESTVPLPQIVFVEGVDMLVSKVNDIKAVAYFMHEVHKIAERYNIAFVLSTGSPKTKEGHGYTSTRDNILGSSGWGRSAGAVVSLLFPKNDDSSGRRKLTVMLRNAPTEKFNLVFVDGRLEIDPDNHDEDSGDLEPESKEIDWYKTQARLSKTDPTKKWWTVTDMERALNLSHSTADRHIKHDHTKAHLMKKTRGQGVRGQATQYRWNESKTNPLWVEQQEQEKAEQVEAF